MNMKKYLKTAKDSLEEIMNVTPYDLITFGSSEDEQTYIEKKTEEFDITDALLEKEDNDGIIVITEEKTYSISPVFIHDDSFVKLFKFLDDGKEQFCKPDIIEHYNNRGNILIRVTNHDGILGFDSYIPERISDYQVRTLDRYARELGSVYSELEEYDDHNAKNIKYGIRTIRESLLDNVPIKRLK